MVAGASEPKSMVLNPAVRKVVDWNHEAQILSDNGKWLIEASYSKKKISSLLNPDVFYDRIIQFMKIIII